MRQPHKKWASSAPWGWALPRLELKPHLKMAEQRLAILNSKKTNLIKTQRGESRSSYETLEEEKARIRVEGVIGTTSPSRPTGCCLCSASCCERAALITSEKDCPPTYGRRARSSGRRPRGCPTESRRRTIGPGGKGFFNDARKNIGEKTCLRENAQAQASRRRPPTCGKVPKAIAEAAKSRGRCPTWT